MDGQRQHVYTCLQDGGWYIILTVVFVIGRHGELGDHFPLHHFEVLEGDGTTLKSVCKEFIYFIKANTRAYMYKGDAGLVKTIRTPLPKLPHSHKINHL